MSDTVVLYKQLEALIRGFIIQLVSCGPHLRKQSKSELNFRNHLIHRLIETVTALCTRTQPWAHIHTSLAFPAPCKPM